VRLGVVSSARSGCAVLQVAGPAPRPGTPVAVVRLLPGQPQTVLEAHVVQSRACIDGSGGPAAGRRVVLDLGAAELLPGEPAIGVVDPPRPVAVSGGHATADLDGDGVPARFRACTTQEGVHLTVWRGEPLHGPRRWHAYYYIGHDTEPTCEEADWRE
jgi:hypothetical protein